MLSLDTDGRGLELGGARLCGSQASMVSWFTSASSGKWTAMKASPGRSPGSRRAGTTMLPRRDVTLTGTPSSTPSRSASSGARSIDPLILRGDSYLPDWTPVLYESSRLPGGEPDRIVVGELVARRCELHGVEGRLPADVIAPQAAVEEGGPRVVVVGARPLQAAGLGETRIRHAAVEW